MRYNIPPKKIEAWVEENFDVKKRRRGGQELIIINPLTGHDKPRLNINLDGRLHDWGGDEWAGPPNPKTGKRPAHIIRFVQLYRGVSFREALQELVGSSSLTYALRSSKPKEVEEDTTETVSAVIPSEFHLLDNPNSLLKKPVWNYLKSRGYTEAEILNQEIHHSVTDALWLYTEFGELVYMQSRNIYSKRFWFPPTDITDANGKKIGELGVTRDDVLYGFDDVPRAEYIILTESIFDKNTLGKHALSTGGVILSKGQLKRINLIGPKEGVVLAPDNDAPAIESILTNAPRLRDMGYKVFFSIPPRIELPNGEFTKDWNELLTGAKLTKSQTVETMNQRLVPFNGSTKLQLTRLLMKSRKGKNNGKKTFKR